MTSLCCACVEQSTVGVVERCGKYNRLVGPGLNWVFCCVGDRISGNVSLRIQSLSVTVETKTNDNVFVKVVVSLQYQASRRCATDGQQALRVSQPGSQQGRPSARRSCLTRSTTPTTG